MEGVFLNKTFKYENGYLFLKLKTGKWKQATEKLTEKGYKKQITINNKLEKKNYKQHRMIYKICNPEWDIESELVINHKNGNRADNRIENLEAITHKENNQDRDIKPIGVNKGYGFEFSYYNENGKRKYKTFKKRDEGLEWYYKNTKHYHRNIKSDGKFILKQK
jgi:hypothetical protein